MRGRMGRLLIIKSVGMCDGCSMIRLEAKFYVDVESISNVFDWPFPGYKGIGQIQPYWSQRCPKRVAALGCWSDSGSGLPEPINQSGWVPTSRTSLIAIIPFGLRQRSCSSPCRTRLILSRFAPPPWVRKHLSPLRLEAEEKGRKFRVAFSDCVYTLQLIAIMSFAHAFAATPRCVCSNCCS